MKSISFCIALSITVLCSLASAKTVNVPSSDITQVIRIARQYLASQHVDLSHRFLSCIEYKNLHEEHAEPYWELTWSLLAGTSEGQLYVCVSNTGQVSAGAVILACVHCSPEGSE